MRGIGRRFAPDDGMTLVEVIVAAAILFFIMTAILGLVGRTTLMSVQARQMNSVNNAVNSYIEWVRGLPFGDVAVAPSGSLETTVVTTADCSVRIVPTVEPILKPDGTTDSFLKNLWLAITATRSDGTTRVTNTMVVVHDHEQFLEEGSQGLATDPTISFVGATPPQGTIVWKDASTGLSQWKDATGTLRNLYVAVRAEATSGRSLEEVYIQGEQTWDLQEYPTGISTSKIYARWFNPTWTDSPSFWWDLRQQTSLNEPLVQDGFRSVYAYVKDSAGVIRYEVRQFLVDTYAPSPTPWPLVHDGTGSMCGSYSWPQVMDGTTPAYRYAIDSRQQPKTPTTSLYQWTSVWGYVGPATSSPVLGNSPMSRNYARVRALSPRGLATSWSAMVVFVTRPKMTGSFTVLKRTSTPKGWTVDAQLQATPPSFESTGTTYAWYEGTTLLGTSTSNTFTPPRVIADGDTNTTPFPSRSYSVIVSTQPLGPPSFASNPAVEVKSNIVTTFATASGTYTFPEGTW